MKKIGIVSVCILVILVIIYTATSTDNRNAYDNKKTTPAEGEEVVTNPKVETTETETLNTDNGDKEAIENEMTPPVTVEESVNQTPDPAETETIVEETPPKDRTIYADGFYYEPLSPEIKEKITGVSFHENENITYDDLRYVKVLYVDFNGNTQEGELICNKAIAQDLVEIFKELYENAYQIDKIRLIDEYGGDDDLSCEDNNTSSFNYRVVAGTDNLSKHALGLAIDINPFQNPYITYPNGVERISPAGSEPYADRNSGLPHMILEGDLCYNLFIEHGFTWGGHWKTLKDYQHFQKTL